MVGDRSERPGAAPRQFRLEPEAPSPRLRAHQAEPRLELEAGEPIDPLYQPKTPRGRRDPIFGASPRRAEAAWRDTREPPHRSAVVPIAAGVLLVAVGATALWYYETPSLPVAEAVTPSPAASVIPSVPTPAATVPKPPSPPAVPVHSAVTLHPPASPTKKPDADLPRDMLQPQIVSAPPALPPLPAVKREPQLVVRAVATKPQAVPSLGADADLPAPIAAVLHPEAGPPAAAKATSQPAPTPPAATATAVPLSPASNSNEVTVNGVSYVNGEQPHSLGTLGAVLSSTTPATPPAAVAPNGPAVAPAAVPPGEVVISRAPASPLSSVPASSNAPSASSTSYNAVVSGSPRGIVVTPVPAISSDSNSGNGASASGPPTAIQVAPAPGSSNP
ncbi:MAG TPA: hypothetical protein VEU53_08065 [Stellaceae bacterium]|nr:hypothetical protein [Stellaceae bacterium]